MSASLRGGSAYLAVAGERSGDGMAAAVIERLGQPCYGLGGAAMRRAGASPLLDLAPLSCMGVGPALWRSRALVTAGLQLLRWAKERRPRAALLVGFSEFNARLAPRLRALGCRVVWYSPPQAWAWRPGRAPRLARAADDLAVLFPFEQAWWRARGANAHFVGHPAFARAGGTGHSGGTCRSGGCDRPLVTLLPGSRTGEVQQHLPALLAGFRRYRALLAAQGALPLERAATVVLADSLGTECTRWATRLIEEHGCRAAPNAALAETLERSWVAVVASGSATLDVVAAGVPPIIVYRLSRWSWQLAQHLVRVEHAGLPNLLLGEPCFPELLQAGLEPDNVAHSLMDVRRRPAHYAALVSRVQHLFGAQPVDPASSVAELLAARLSPGVSTRA